MKKTVKTAIAMILCLCLALPAFAAAPANSESFITNLPEAGFCRSSDDGVDPSGYLVTPNKDLKVTAVGYPANFLEDGAQTVQIAEFPDAGWGEGIPILDALTFVVGESGDPAVGVVISADDNYDAKTGMNWVALDTPVTLKAGKTYMIIGTMKGANKDAPVKWFASIESDYPASVTNAAKIVDCFYGWWPNFNSQADRFQENYINIGATFYYEVAAEGEDDTGSNNEPAPSPSTGDNSLIYLALTLLLGASAGFVLLRKKARG